MAQTGDGQRGDGTGGSKYPNLPAEFSNVPFKRGIVGMARATSPNSANSQFFIMFDEAPSLNGQYTVIGEVVSGMAAVDKIKKGSAANNGAVTDPDRIVHMQVAADAKESKRKRGRMTPDNDDVLILETTRGLVTIAMRPDLAPR